MRVVLPVYPVLDQAVNECWALTPAARATVAAMIEVKCMLVDWGKLAVGVGKSLSLVS